jgi:hypothetical protein
MSKVGKWLFELRLKNDMRLKDVSDGLGKSMGFCNAPG